MADTGDKKSANNRLPVTVLLNNIRQIPLNMQKDFELIFVLRGELFTAINNNQYHLTKPDIILINSGDAYQAWSEKENLVLTIRIDYDFFIQAVDRKLNIYLCNSSIDHKNNYDDIRKIMSKVMYEYFHDEIGRELKIMSLLYDLIYLLEVNFILTDFPETEQAGLERSKYKHRMDKILAYIKQNYTREISLKDVADSQFLTPEYLSKFFRNQMGMTFSRYLNEFRLLSAVKELIRTDDSVTRVAMNNGFPNLAAFNKIFKEKYDSTPAEYRIKIRKKQSADSVPGKADFQITKADYTEAFEQLKEYTSNIVKASEKKQCSDLKIKININMDTHPRKVLLHSWRNLINLGYAPDGLRSDFQQHLKDIQAGINFKYARFQGIFSDEMLIHGEETVNETGFNFNKIDRLIDFLYSIGMKPFIELSDKAKLLNLTPEEIIYYKPSLGKQRSFNEFLALLERFIIHCVNRYGIDEVSQWYFELWKPGEKNIVFWDGNFDRYIDTFQACYKIIKNIVPNARFGGPGISPEINIGFLEKLLKQWNNRGITPDFLSVSLYFVKLIEDSHSKIKNSEEYILSDCQGKNYLSSLSMDKNFSRNTLEKIRNILASSKINIPEIHVTEWNSTISHRQPPNDLTFKGAFIVKNIADNLDETDSFGYWFCSDISGELKDSKTLLYGEMGLISANGIKKPGFYAFEMLSKLGNKLVEKGDGYIITSTSNNNYEIIAYNYKHYSDFYCLNPKTALSLDKYYDIFEDLQHLHLCINLKGIKKGRYRIKKYELNRRHGSIFDQWMNMNVINNIRQSEINYLRQICIPKQSVSYVENTDEIKIDSTLEPHEVNLYEITFEYD